MWLVNLTTGTAIATEVERPTSRFGRMKGLIGRADLSADEGLWLDRCSTIHTIGVRVPLDIVFLDGGNRVIKLLVGVGPLRPAIFCKGAQAVVELGTGAIAGARLSRGDVLALVT